MSSLYVSKLEAIELLGGGFSLKTLSRMVAKYHFRTRKSGKQSLICRADINSYLSDYANYEDVEEEEEVQLPVNHLVYQRVSDCAYEVNRLTDRDEDSRQLAMSGTSITNEVYRTVSSEVDLVNVFDAPTIKNPLAGIDFAYLAKLTPMQRDIYLRNR